MKEIYQFTLVLKGVDENTPNLEDALYESGCDDALINFRNGTVFLDFERQANSLKEAVLSAIKDIESAHLGQVVTVGPEDLVTESEIAKRTSNTRQTISLWSKDQRRQSFPKPIMKLSDRSPLWKWREVAEWLYKNKLIDDQELKKAQFLEAINSALELRNPNTQMESQKLLKEITHNKKSKPDPKVDRT